MAKKIQSPLTDETIAGLEAGDSVLITGTIYTGRDLAHKRLVDALVTELDVIDVSSSSFPDSV